MPMTKRLSDVARYAGVSEATVSRVLNQKPGVTKATQELVLTALDVLGYERIGMVLGPADHVPSARKLAAFQELCGPHGTDPELVERGLFSMEGGQAAGLRLLRKGATGVICASDVLALGVVRAARREGLGVPAGLSVVG